MISETQPTPGKFSTYQALTSFGIGTAILLLHLAFRDNFEIMALGFFFLIGAFLLNLITLVYLLWLMIPYWHDRETLTIRIFILLSNIPIAFLYLNIVFSNN